MVRVVVLVVGAVVPRSAGLGPAERWPLTAAVPLRAVARHLSPLVTLFGALTRRLAARLGGESDIETPHLD